MKASACQDVDKGFAQCPLAAYVAFKIIDKNKAVFSS